ncbi:MAG: DUF4912 domain-containing protein [Acidobacteriota bacterium]
MFGRSRLDNRPVRRDVSGLQAGGDVPFFFDLSSLAPVVERNPFEPLLVPQQVKDELSPAEKPAGESAEPVADFGLPIPDQYDFDLMRALVQDPFRLYVYWNLRNDPWERVRRIFPPHEVNNFQFALRLIDETNNIAVFFEVPYTREYWFNVFPDRSYRVELGLRSPTFGYIKLLSTQAVKTPRGGPSNQVAPDEEYSIGADDYLRVLRESHLIPERAWGLDGVAPSPDAAAAGALTTAGPGVLNGSAWEALPPTFRRIMRVIGDIQAGRAYDRWWEQLEQEELAELVREFLTIIRGMGDGEMGYILLMRYLPELLRRAIRAEGGEEIRVDKPVSLFLAERLGQSSSEMGPGRADGQEPGEKSAGGAISMGQWMPSLSVN